MYRPRHYQYYTINTILSILLEVCLRFPKCCWVGKHVNIITKPTNSPTQGQPNPILGHKLKVAFGPLFSHSNYFFVGWDWFYAGNRLQDTDPTKFSANTLLIIILRGSNSKMIQLPGLDFPSRFSPETIEGCDNAHNGNGGFWGRSRRGLPFHRCLARGLHSPSFPVIEKIRLETSP